MRVQTAETKRRCRFSALQRAEIAEIALRVCSETAIWCFSALQRAEIAEIFPVASKQRCGWCFSALQRAEIAEIAAASQRAIQTNSVSVLFNEPKLLKSCSRSGLARTTFRFSALQRAEIAEMNRTRPESNDDPGFSALQRAEIAEIVSRTGRLPVPV